MNSCLYECKVTHHRKWPKEHRFQYNIFMFYLNLDELDQLSGKMKFFSRNRFNIFNFRDSDHLEISKKTTKENIIEYLEQNGLKIENPKIWLMTHLRTFGYVFNPVSFYFVYDGENNPVCSVAEVGNTFGEIKPFLLNRETLTNNTFHLKTTKYFYVSPFTDLDDDFDFNLSIPDEKLKIQIDTYKNENQYFIAIMNGKRKLLTDLQLLRYTLKFPFITLNIIVSIHYQAFKLWMKKLSFHRKTDHINLQRGVYNYGKFS